MSQRAYNFGEMNGARFSELDLTGDARGQGERSSGADGDKDGGLKWDVIIGQVINGAAQVGAAAVRKPDITNPGTQPTANPNQLVTIPPPPQPKSNTGVIVAAAVGGVLLIGLIAIVAMKK